MTEGFWVTPSILRETRLRARLSQSQLGRVLGCTRSYIAGLENGHHKITREIEARYFRLVEEGTTLHKIWGPGSPANDVIIMGKEVTCRCGRVFVGKWGSRRKLCPVCRPPRKIRRG